MDSWVVGKKSNDIDYFSKFKCKNSEMNGTPSHYAIIFSLYYNWNNGEVNKNYFNNKGADVTTLVYINMTKFVCDVMICWTT